MTISIESLNITFIFAAYILSNYIEIKWWEYIKEKIRFFIEILYTIIEDMNWGDLIANLMYNGKKVNISIDFARLNWGIMYYPKNSKLAFKCKWNYIERRFLWLIRYW